MVARLADPDAQPVTDADAAAIYDTANASAAAISLYHEPIPLKVRNTDDHCPAAIERQVFEPKAPVERAQIVIERVRQYAEETDIFRKSG